MTMLILGLILFLATHSLRIFAEDWRQRQIARLGDKPWKGVMSALSLVTLILLIWGFGQARQDPQILYLPPLWLKHVAIALTLPAFLLFAASGRPPSHVKQRVGHPMVLGVKLWSFAHLLANGGLHHVVLFGGLLVWSTLSFVAARKRDRKAGVAPVAGSLTGDVVVILAGSALWAAMLLVGHRWLIGVDPLPM